MIDTDFNGVRAGASLIGGALTAAVLPVLPYAAICTVMVAADMVTAWTLSRRVARRYGPAARAAGAGKLQSRKLWAAIVTLGKIYAMLIVAAAVDRYIVCDGSGEYLRFCAGAVCFRQAVSVLENESSCSDARWARVALRWLIDKAGRHF